MHALSDEERRRIMHGLGIEEIVTHVLNAAAKGWIGGRGFCKKWLALGDHVVGFVLDDEGEGGKLLG